VTPEPTRRRFGGLVAVASIGVLIVAGVLLALVLSRGSRGSSSQVGAGAGAGVLPTAPASVPVTTARSTTRPRPAGAPGSWPVGVTGFTVVVSTLAKRDHPRAAAERLARTVQVPGVVARVLDSSQHPRLRPNVWIVYVGRYATRSRAQRVARQLRAAGVERGIVERLTG
jgi:hypothetical protein